MTYRNQPTARNLPPYDLADGRSYEQSIRDFNERYGVIEVECQVFNPTTGEWESERPSSWDMWAAGCEGGEK